MMLVQEGGRMIDQVFLFRPREGLHPYAGQRVWVLAEDGYCIDWLRKVFCCTTCIDFDLREDSPFTYLSIREDELHPIEIN
ncbi:MAG: hypothetical protein HOE53_03235 [Candidatus Magasanikbacteria bacterium]|jgi:hypothetical protein|nr:hypothetical protein [Candidatus Magasanikbacteria bacterium]